MDRMCVYMYDQKQRSLSRGWVLQTNNLTLNASNAHLEGTDITQTQSCGTNNPSLQTDAIYTLESW